MSDQLSSGQIIRIFTLVDDFTREALAIEAGIGFTGHQVARILARMAQERGLPKTIRVDNVSEFTSRALDQWAYLNGVTLDFSRPGKPTDNPFVEAFNGRLRAECLNQHRFLSLNDAREKLEAWRVDYNQVRLHSALGCRPPAPEAMAVPALAAGCAPPAAGSSARRLGRTLDRYHDRGGLEGV